MRGLVKPVDLRKWWRMSAVRLGQRPRRRGFDQTLASFADISPNLSKCGADSAKCGRFGPKLGQTWPSFAKRLSCRTEKP